MPKNTTQRRFPRCGARSGGTVKRRGGEDANLAEIGQQNFNRRRYILGQHYSSARSFLIMPRNTREFIAKLIKEWFLTKVTYLSSFNNRGHTYLFAIEKHNRDSEDCNVYFKKMPTKFYERINYIKKSNKRFRYLANLTTSIIVVSSVVASAAGATVFAWPVALGATLFFLAAHGLQHPDMNKRFSPKILKRNSSNFEDRLSESMKNADIEYVQHTMQRRSSTIVRTPSLQKKRSLESKARRSRSSKLVRNSQVTKAHKSSLFKDTLELFTSWNGCIENCKIKLNRTNHLEISMKNDTDIQQLGSWNRWYILCAGDSLNPFAKEGTMTEEQKEAAITQLINKADRGVAPPKTDNSLEAPPMALPV